LPFPSVVAGWYFATPTSPQEPTPPEQRTGPVPVSSPFGEDASMSTFAYRLQPPPDVPQYEETSSLPVAGS
jgi:hypothetical protein